MNGHKIVFMTKSPRKNVPDVGIELGTACMPSELAFDRATAPGDSVYSKKQLRHGMMFSDSNISPGSGYTKIQ